MRRSTVEMASAYEELCTPVSLTHIAMGGVVKATRLPGCLGTDSSVLRVQQGADDPCIPFVEQMLGQEHFP